MGERKPDSTLARRKAQLLQDLDAARTLAARHEVGDSTLMGLIRKLEREIDSITYAIERAERKS